MKVTQELQSLRAKDIKQLRKSLSDNQLALHKAIADVAFGRSTKNATVSQLRKQIARIQTILRERELTNE